MRWTRAGWRAIGDAESSAAAYRRALALDENDWSLWLRHWAFRSTAPTSK
jgi:hypothetical protein